MGQLLQKPDSVWAAFGYRPDVGGLNFGPTTPVDDLEASDRTTVGIGRADMPPEVGVADFAIEQHFNDATFPNVLGRIEKCEGGLVDIREPEPERLRIVARHRLAEAGTHDIREVILFKRSD